MNYGHFRKNRRLLLIDLDEIALTIATIMATLPLYQTYVSFVNRSLRICGLYPDTIHRSLSSRIIPPFWLLCYGIILYTVTTCLVQNVTDMSKVTAGLSGIIAIVNAIVKAFRFVTYRGELEHVNGVLETVFEESSDRKPANSPAFRLMGSFYRLGYYQYVCLLFTSFVFVVRPLLAVRFRNANYSLPVPGVYPWTINSTPVYVIHYVIESHICWSLCVVTIGVDAFFTLCTFRISSVFKLLALEFEELPKRPIDKENRELTLRTCIRRHSTLIHCYDVIQEIYGPIVLVVALGNALSMCSMMFEVFQSKEFTVGKIIATVIYLFGKLIQTFIYAWPGEVVATESDAFRCEVYCNDWYEHIDDPSAKFFLMILKQKPIVIRACSILEVSLDLFAKIINRTISYYFLLVTLDDGS